MVGEPVTKRVEHAVQDIGRSILVASYEILGPRGYASVGILGLGVQIAEEIDPLVGRVLHWNFLGPIFQRKSLNPLYTEIEPKNLEGKCQFAGRFAKFHYRYGIGSGIADPLHLRGRTGSGGPIEKARRCTTPWQEHRSVRAEGNRLRIPVGSGMSYLAKNRHVLLRCEMIAAAPLPPFDGNGRG
jgi:hypothetical protein